MNEKYYFTLAEAARLVEVNDRKLSSQLESVEPVKAFRFKYKGKSREVLYSLEDLNNHDVPYSVAWLHEQIKKMFIVVNSGTPAAMAAYPRYAFTITDASRLTGKSRSWILILIQEGKITKFSGRRIKDAHIKKSLISANDLSLLGMEFKPDDVFKLFTLK